VAIKISWRNTDLDEASDNRHLDFQINKTIKFFAEFLNMDLKHLQLPDEDAGKYLAKQFRDLPV
jgi:hypothetical protein